MQRDSESATRNGRRSGSRIPTSSGTPESAGSSSPSSGTSRNTERTGSPIVRGKGWHHESLRAVEGCRSPYFNALKRRVKIDEQHGGYRLELAEQREVLVPWIRLPLITYWRIRLVHGGELASIETVARTFLETGHVPAQWFI